MAGLVELFGMRKALRSLLPLVLLLVVGGAVVAEDAHPSVGHPVGDFTLTNQHAQPTRLADLHGKVWVADFIFTRCPDACWNMTQALVGMQDLLKRYPDLRFVSFSIDPKFDTPPILVKYCKVAKVTSPNWWFLTGSMDTITQVAHSFLLATLTPDDDILSHSTEFAVVDKDGIIRGYYDLDVAADVPALRQHLEKLLSSP